MSSLFDRLEDQLRGAANAQVGARPGAAPAAPHRSARPGRLRTWVTTGGRMLPVGLALASAAAVVIAAFTLLHGGSRSATKPPAGGGGSSLPSPWSARARREGHELSRLLAPVQRSAVCKTPSGPGPEGPTGRPGRALRDELGVLRRPFHPLRLRSSVDLGLSGVDPYTERDWRLARVSDGATFIVVPVRVQPGAGQPGARCLEAQARALQRDARRIPAGIRAQTVYLGGRELAYLRRIVTRPPYDSVCLIESGRSSAGGDCGSQTPRALRRPSLPELSSGNPLHRAAYVGVVPDGVAWVTVRVPKRPGHAAETLRGSVVGNVVVVPASSALQRAVPQVLPTVIWRDAAGRITARVRPAERGSRAYCLSHRLECLTLMLADTTSGGGTSASGRGSATTATSAPTRSATPGG
jgi:hypothetical protein